MLNLKIDADRLWNTLQETAKMGGTPDGGIRRLTLSQEDLQVRNWFQSSCEALGCTVSVDEIGNMFAVRPGKNAGELPIAMGSHLDTQPTGGKFDGILGVLAGLEVLRTLHDSGYETNRPFMVINWTNEEGARFAPAMLGSAIYAGVFDRAFADSREDADGVKFGDALDSIGYRGSHRAGDVRFGAMFELHIEQGPVLEREGIELGVVTGVQAMRWYDLTITGQEAHAGTMPMEMRDNALSHAARIILAAEKMAVDMHGLVTVGHLDITAPSRNVVPGKVRVSIDLRHAQDDALAAMEQKLLAIIDGECSSDHVTLTKIWESPSVQFNGRCLDAIRDGARATGASMREIVSGAGHDSVNTSKVAPTAMIFIPCRNGLSHNPLEYASKSQCTLGAQTLLNAVLNYDRSAEA